MDEILKWIGGLFIAASIFICLAGLYDLYKNGKRVTEEGIFKVLGLTAMFVWIIIGFGVGSWLISVLFIGVPVFLWRVVSGALEWFTGIF